VKLHVEDTVDSVAAGVPSSLLALSSPASADIIMPSPALVDIIMPSPASADIIMPSLASAYTIIMLSLASSLGWTWLVGTPAELAMDSVHLL
jgi:hypothetical protein